jgi:hypothetical protein
MPHTHPPLRSAGVLAAGALAAAALAAFGGGSDTATGAGPTHKAEQAGLNFARCMREHGVNVPDPKPDQRGFVFHAQARGRGGGNPATLEAADRACRHYLEGAVRHPSGSELNKIRDSALKWARCMRQNGVNVPDPSTSTGGAIRIGPGQGADPNSPTFQNADRQCRHLLPKGPGAGASTGSAQGKGTGPSTQFSVAP